MFSLFRKPKTKPNTENKNEIANLESFLIGTGTDRHGRTYNQIIRYNDLQLENDHSYIQWVFPTETQSEYNALAPVMSREQAKKLADIGLVKENLHRMFMRMLLFYGVQLMSNIELEEKEEDTIVVVTKGRRTSWVFHKARIEEWLQNENHNLLRISRILECLRLFERETDHKLLCKIVNSLVEYKPEIKTWSCWEYWTDYMVYEMPETERVAAKMGERLQKMTNDPNVMNALESEHRNHDVFGN